MRVIVRFFSLLLVYSYLICATEIDSFTLRDHRLADATAELNQLMNAYMQESIQAANSWNRCDEDAFATDLHERLGGFFWSAFENALSISPAIAQLALTREQSIYQDFSFIHAPALFIARLGSLVRIGDYFIGSDKFGHFLDTGFAYYKIIKKDNNLDKALAFGEESERTYYGLQATGIYSYADLAANYHGLIGLWLKLISTKAKNPDSYVVCHNKHYYQARLFDWAQHINASWDEAFNRNTYRNAIMHERVQARIQKLKQHPASSSCPLDPQEYQELIAFYGDKAPRLLSPHCFRSHN